MQGLWGLGALGFRVLGGRFPIQWLTRTLHMLHLTGAGLSFS